ncbi:hypothetical protein A0H81_07735 [Grifola frondosa]|uniref:Uncharacterized protein n=1 Tax=Grifola frondosa TaxID=5627 RepID=A0A1C7M6C1_GRIFR|nr:hypothetical protein A0H81_07735 [Grifola frondosa]
MPNEKWEQWRNNHIQVQLRQLADDYNDLEPSDPSSSPAADSTTPTADSTAAADSTTPATPSNVTMEATLPVNTSTVNDGTVGVTTSNK